MNHLGRAAILLVLGVMTLRLIATGGFGWFVAQHMRLPLLAAGVVMLLLGAAEYFAATRKPQADTTVVPAPSPEDAAATGLEDAPLGAALPAVEAAADAEMSIDLSALDRNLIGQDDVAADAEAGHGAHDDHDDDKAHLAAGPKVGWLLVAPLAVLIAVAPTGLGAAAADRVDAYIPTDASTAFEPLPVLDVPVEIGVLDFLNRAVWDDQRSLEGVTVQMTGLVVNDPEVPDGFKLTKFLVGCCAADGLPVQVVVRGVSQPLENDTWVDAVGTWIVPDVPHAESGDTPALQLESVAILDSPPTNPYESW